MLEGEKQQRDGQHAIDLKEAKMVDFCLTAVVNETVTAHNFKYKVQNFMVTGCAIFSYN